MKIVLVGTDGALGQSLQERSRSNVKVIEAGTGAEGFEAALREGGDVIVCDIHTPVFDGFDLLKIVRNSRLRATPVILYSLLEEGTGNADRARVEGADAYVSSLNSVDLVEAIEKHLHRLVAPSSAASFLPTGNLSASSAVLTVSQRAMLQEEELRQAQKMEALGTLCGGIAHDFNNILTAIIGFANVLLLRLDNDNLNPLVENIVAAAERAAALTSSLLAFSRKQPIHLRSTDLNTTIADMATVLGRLLPQTVKMSIVTAQEPLMIDADPGQLGQALVNLATNARDAMIDGGEIRIETSSVVIDDDFIHSHGFGSPGRFALLSFCDDGTGMDDVTLQRMYEPFFTTKARGKGTGLGLSIVYGVVRQHHGFIRCSSVPGHGTAFKIYLPLSN